ncbi:MAG: LysE family transporter [Bacteroidales bacterium]|nr:LysE family transporter [Bacteroides sp.]MCM1198077.1 LysE family transporter [Clostridium sp.]MCM1502477.1 LysE family transporter [Bacteroidales bacterium]
MLIDIIKGFIIGICASAPIGPIAILVVQKTLSKGRKAGFITGMGACIVDTIFAIIALFALTFAQEFMASHKELIFIVGGIIVAILGWSMTTSNPFRKLRSDTVSSISVKDFLQSLMMGLSNPGAILVIFTLFAFFGIGSPDKEDWSMLPVILSVSAGAAVWWFGVTALLDHFRKKFKMRTILWINRITGAIVIIIGIALLGEGLYRVIFQGLPLR